MSELSPNQKVRELPAVDKLLSHPSIEELAGIVPRSVIVEAARDTLESLRLRLLAGDIPNEQEMQIQRIASTVHDLAYKFTIPSIRRVVNATGVILHTGLGRAVLPESTQRAIQSVALGHCNLEIDVETGMRGSRSTHYRKLLADLCETEDAYAVNNNAAAVLLALNTFANGREVIVSRGQLVEIGGSFRLPDIMAASGAQLVEVGTTNRTRLSDYERAISDRTALIMRVHPSNYRIVGFTEEVPLGDLVSLGRRCSIPVLDDIGSGDMVDLSQYGLRGEPLVSDSVRAGADIVVFSGDKLLGGPQSGLIVGNKQHIEAMAQNPLSRCLRIDKLTVAMIESILNLHNDRATLCENIPTFYFITRPIEDIDRAALKIKKKLVNIGKGKLQVDIIDGFSEIGGGALPGEQLPTKLVSISAVGISPMDMAKAFRTAEPPVFGRVGNDRFILDLRTVNEDEMQDILQAAARIIES